MISLVNGYVCKSSQDVADAMQGKQPPARLGELPYSSGSDGKISAFLDRPAASVDTAKDTRASVSAEAGPQIDAQAGDSGGAAGVNLLV